MRENIDTQVVHFISSTNSLSLSQRFHCAREVRNFVGMRNACKAPCCWYLLKSSGQSLIDSWNRLKESCLMSNTLKERSNRDEGPVEYEHCKLGAAVFNSSTGRHKKHANLRQERRPGICFYPTLTRTGSHSSSNISHFHIQVFLHMTLSIPQL